MINEVALRPYEFDLDGDAIANTRDEYIELVSLSEEPIHLKGVSVFFRQQLRGTVLSNSCIEPGQAIVLVGSTTGTYLAPKGSLRLPLNHPLRLTDNGGELVVKTTHNSLLDAILLQGAGKPSLGIVTRERDGDRFSAMVSHPSHPWSDGKKGTPGTCVNGDLFPSCASWQREAVNLPNRVSQSDDDASMA